jgi:hypothetical protein
MQITTKNRNKICPNRLPISDDKWNLNGFDKGPQIAHQPAQVNDISAPLSERLKFFIPAIKPCINPHGAYNYNKIIFITHIII